MIYLFQHYLLKNRRRKNLKIFFFIFILCKIIIISGAPLPSRKILEKEQIIKNQKMDEENRQFMQTIRLRALNNIQRSLESLSSLTANSLMLKTALQSSESIEEEKNEEEENEELNSTNKPLDEEEILTTFSPLSSIEIQTENKNKKLNNNKHHSGMRRIRADLRKIPLSSTSSYELLNKEQESEESTISINILSSTTGPTRRLRSAVIATQQNLKNNVGHYSHHQHHRRRRKGCPQIHGKDQLLCPTRNTYKYDVCITREQICDRIRDCPGGEDEDSRHCFFFRPLESSLKTLSHAVLLLVDTVMREQEEIQHLEQRNEL